MKYSFSTREKTLLVVLALLVVSLAYYLVVWEPCEDNIALANVSLESYQDETIIENARNANLQKMKTELEKLKSSGTNNTSQIPQYDNLQNVMSELQKILTGTTGCNLNFESITFNNNYASRPVNITFQCENYESAKSVISSFYYCKYRCQIGSVQLSVHSSNDTGSAEISTSPLRISLRVTFIENCK